MLLPSASPDEAFNAQEGCTCFEIALGLRSSVPEHLQWQARSGLLALSSQGPGANAARIDVIDPAWPQVRTHAMLVLQACPCRWEIWGLQATGVLHVPLNASQQEQLLGIAWAPALYRSALLTWTSLGEVGAWSPATSSSSPGSNAWSGQAALRLDLKEPGTWFPLPQGLRPWQSRICAGQNFAASQDMMYSCPVPCSPPPIAGAFVGIGLARWCQGTP